MSEPIGSPLERIRAGVERWGESEGVLAHDPCELGSNWGRLAPAIAPVLIEFRELVLGWLAATRCTPADGRVGWEHAPASFLRARTLFWVHRHYPFARLAQADQVALERFYDGLLGSAREVLTAAEGPEELTARLAELLGRAEQELVRHLRASVVRAEGWLCPTVSAEYSAELQLGVLGLDLAGMAEPILDLGCGERANLVRYLRGRGKAAVGIDRYSSANEGVREADWFSLPLAPHSWGTIIAHQSFSLHFLHHHLAPGHEAQRYARRYRELLGALRHGGAFAYAPGLPFIESWLAPEEFKVARRALSGIPEQPELTTRWAAVLGESPLYAARVERL